VGIDSSQSFADSSRAGIVERHVLCFAESAAPSGNNRLQSSLNFGSRKKHFNYYLQKH